MHSLCKKYSSKKRQRVLLIQGGERCCGRTGERTPLVPLQACAGWAKTVNCHAHPRILLPQNRCLPEPLAAPFPRQPEPRCNTLDFASKVVCAKGMLRPLWKPKRNAHQLRCSSSASALIRLTMGCCRNFCLFTVYLVRAILKSVPFSRIVFAKQLFFKRE